MAAREDVPIYGWQGENMVLYVDMGEVHHTTTHPKAAAPYASPLAPAPEMPKITYVRTKDAAGSACFVPLEDRELIAAYEYVSEFEGNERSALAAELERRGIPV